MWAWRFYYYLNEHHVLGYAGALIDQPESYFHDLAIIGLVRQHQKATKGVPRMKKVDIISQLKAGGTLSTEWETNGKG